MVNLIHKTTAGISARMVRSTAETLDDDIATSLRELCQVLEADRGGLVVVHNGSPVGYVAYAFYSDGAPRVGTDVNLVELFPWAYHVLVEKKAVFHVPSLSQLPPEAEVDVMSHRSLGTRSILSIPLVIGERVHHILTLHWLKVERTCPGEIIRQVAMLGEIFVSALHRSEAEENLRQANVRLTLAANSARCSLWELDLSTGVFWATVRGNQLFGFEPDARVSLSRFLRTVHAEDRDMVKAAIERTRSMREELDMEYRIRTKGGGVLWVASKGRVQEMGAERRPSLVGVTTDITARKEMEMQLQERVQEIERLKGRLEKENEFLRHEAGAAREHGEIVGSSSKIRAVLTQVAQVARTGSTVLLQGETGTGKGLLAQAIHNLSDRCGRPMIKVNCAALPGGLVESELFGREKGAFTGALSRQKGRFEMAHGSTIFLDEISEISLETQAKLLRVLQDGEFERLGSPQTMKVDVRVIAATNRSLEEEVEQGRFRRDLYYRLSIFPIVAPPLRERPEDIPQLVWEFVAELGERMGKRIRRIASRDMETLQAYPWPGNVRELRNVIEHSVIVSRGETLELRRLAPCRPAADTPSSLVDLERRHIESVLRRTKGRIKGAGGAAEVLQMKPSTLYSRMRKLGVALARA